MQHQHLFKGVIKKIKHENKLANYQTILKPVFSDEQRQCPLHFETNPMKIRPKNLQASLLVTCYLLFFVPCTLRKFHVTAKAEE